MKSTSRPVKSVGRGIIRSVEALVGVCGGAFSEQRAVLAEAWRADEERGVWWS